MKHPKPRIMIIDKSAEALALLKSYFSDSPFIIRDFQSTTAAEKELSSFNPHLVIVDTEHDVDTSFLFAQSIRDNPHFHAIPIIFTLQLSNDDILRRAYDFESADILSKPCKKFQTLFRVKSNIERYFYHLELQKRLSEIKEKQEDTETLARILTHDISNSMAIINGYAGILKHEKILRASKHAIEIVTHVKDMLSIASGKITLDTSPVNLASAVSDAVLDLEPNLQAKSVTIIKNWNEQDHFNILAQDQALRNQVITNLLSNAIKFSYPNGKIEIEINEKSNAIELKIKDNGQGIPKEILPELFNKYSKTTRLGTAGEKGTGFGLPILKQYLDIFHAKIRVESKHKEEGHSTDHGTEFTLEFKKAS